jgi:hypothetical protein
MLSDTCKSNEFDNRNVYIICPHHFCLVVTDRANEKKILAFQKSAAVAQKRAPASLPDAKLRYGSLVRNQYQIIKVRVVSQESIPTCDDKCVFTDDDGAYRKRE